jgi:hypothetical protein
MRVTIEDLEALKELGEELEENHVETERAMQDEISTCYSIHQLSWPTELLLRRREGRSAGRATTKN